MASERRGGEGKRGGGEGVRKRKREKRERKRVCVCEKGSKIKAEKERGSEGGGEDGGFVCVRDDWMLVLRGRRHVQASRNPWGKNPTRNNNKINNIIIINNKNNNNNTHTHTHTETPKP